MIIKKIISIILLIILYNSIFSSYILISMDDKNQKNHLKAYGIAFKSLKQGIEIEWLLNYEGGSFLIPYDKSIEKDMIIRGISYNIIADIVAQNIRDKIENPEINQKVVKLDVAPKIAVYTPNGKKPWDDAVTLVLTYAEIPYDVIYDSAVINGKLKDYDWLHLHHEDFTGQYGKFYSSYKNVSWYIEEKKSLEESAKKLGFDKVSKMKLAVGLKIKEFVFGGGFLFTMCSGTDSYDIALSAQNTDICHEMFDGDAIDKNCQSKLDYETTMAFKDYKLSQNPNEYEFSNIDATQDHVLLGENMDVFTLFEFSAKWDLIPTILNQNHSKVLKGFMGQTTSFRNDFIKKNVTILGETKSINSAKYINGKLGNGQWTFYGGHDPEDYTHRVGDPNTDLNLHPNSPGYRLILNNILFPAVKKQERKT